MAKSAKLKKSEEKRKARAIKRAQYAADAASGKQKKFQNALSTFSASKHRHCFSGSCGNVGCQKICFNRGVPR